MSDAEWGKCDICGHHNTVSRKYYHYDIDCDCCHSIVNGKNKHFEIVRYCPDCTPVPPKRISVVVEPMTEGETK